MPRRDLSSERIELRSIESEHLDEIHRYQNGECKMEISSILNFDPPWAPLSKDQIKAKLDEARKEDRTVLTGIWSDQNEFIGLAFFGAAWDPWNPHIQVLIWPDRRRKGFGAETARLLLEASFNHYLAHVVGCSLPDWNEEGIAFAESLGFQKQGVRRRAGVFDGDFYDLVYLDILRDEYLSVRSKEGDD
ncbi:MAG: N-acetyltransferase [Methanomassiliicoccales archaeon]|nr:MAG: N-acetyltransferase [Methanomassiliicoccales archaeon]